MLDPIKKNTEKPIAPFHSLKIALVTETYPPEINGVAMTLSHLVEGLARREHDVTVFRPRQAAEAEPSPGKSYVEELFRGIPLPGYPWLRLGLPARQAFLRSWKKLRPDLVHVATEGPLGYSAVLAAGRLGIPTTSSFHTNFHSYSRHYGFPLLERVALAYLRHFHNRTLATFAPTTELNAQLSADGFNGLRLLARGVNTQVFSPVHRSDSLRRRYGVGPDDLLVVHVSRLAAEKNYPLLFATFAAIRRTQPSAKLVVVSDGPLRKKLSGENPEVRFTGFLPRDELAVHYASADLFLYPSLTETFGNVVTEAMASGLPVVAFNYAAANRYLRQGESGWLVDLADASAFSGAAVQLALDPSLRGRMGREARKTAEGISWEQVIVGLERDLLELAGSPARPPELSAN